MKMDKRNDWIEAQRNALLDELRGQGYSDNEIRRIIRSTGTAGAVSADGNEIEWV